MPSSSVNSPRSCRAPQQRGPADGVAEFEASVAAEVDGQGHRSVSVTIKGSIPAGDTMILAFTGSPRSGGSHAASTATQTG